MPPFNIITNMVLPDENGYEIRRILEQLKDWLMLNGQNATIQNSDPWLNVDEVCAMLSCSKRYYQEKRSRGEIEFSKDKKKIFARRSAIEKFLNDHIVK